jgi:hypothetical protein
VAIGATAAYDAKGCKGTGVMILGMSLATFTVVHTVLSLIGIVTGLVVLLGMLGGRKLDSWTAIFLATTVLTSVTGFFFPFAKLLPSHIVGIISLVILAIALVALYGIHLAGAWRWIYVAGAVLALYLNVFVGVVQAFQKLAFLQPFAPTQSEPPFIVAQVVVLAIFVVLGFLALRSFHPEMPA